MNDHRNIQLMLYEYVQGELSQDERSVVDAHLAVCKACSAELETMRATLALLPSPATEPSEERSEQFWNQFASSVIEKTGARKQTRASHIAEVIEWIEELVLLHPKYTYAISGTVAVLLLAFAFWTFRTPEQYDVALRGNSKPLEHHVTPASSDGESNRQLTVQPERVSDYFRRSKIMLVGLANLKTDQSEPLDLSAERRVSRNLIQEARYLKRQPIDPQSREVMNDVEKILIEVANTGSRHNVPNVEIVRSGIHQENLLFKIRMAEAMYDSARFMYASERR